VRNSAGLEDRTFVGKIGRYAEAQVLGNCCHADTSSIGPLALPKHIEHFETWKTPPEDLRDVFGSAAGARLDPALKDRACGAQEGQATCRRRARG
jgi:hypothetical protein